MSIRSKIEAVIYAAEEPVTLVQLVGLLAVEVQGELDAADARQGQLPLGEQEPPLVVQGVEAGDPDALNAEVMGTETFVAGLPDAPESPEFAMESAGAVTPRAPGAAPGDGSEAAPVEAVPQAAREEPVSAHAPPGDVGLPDSSPAEIGTRAADREEELPEQTPASAQGDELSPAEQRLRERRIREYMRLQLNALIAEYRDQDRGLEIREVAGGFRFATKPEYHDAVRGFVRSLKPPLKLSLQALETLAVVAYKQPTTAPEVSDIRGVDSAGVLGSLIGRKLVATAGRKQVIGRPILYKTTKEFLLRFGLKDLSELPSIEEFEKLASEMNEAVQEEIPMAAERLDEMKPLEEIGDAPRNVEPMRGEHAAQADGVPDETDAEELTPPPDGSSEFTGDASVDPADNTEIDGRISGVPPNYSERNDESVDSPALDAEVQGAEGEDQ